MEKVIVMEPSKNIRGVARQALKGKWNKANLAILTYVACIAVPTIIIVAIFGGFSEEALLSEDMMMPGEGLSTLYSVLVSGAFTYGLSLFFLALVRGKKTELGMVFSGFGYFFKTLGLYIVMSIFIALWTLLFIIPGIIASFRYSQAFFILADDPSKGIMQCIRESKEMMKGNKGKYFCLQLSFIGWYLLIYAALIIVGLISTSISLFIPSYSSFIVSMIILIIGFIAVLIGCIVLLPYVMAATTVFYEMVTGNLKRAGEETVTLSQVIENPVTEKETEADTENKVE